MNILTEYILVSGVVQGFILALAVAGQSGKSFANRLLTLFFISYTLDILYAVYTIKDLYSAIPFFIGMGAILPFLYSPALYIYSYFVAHPVEKPGRKILFHFTPAFLLAVSVLISLFIFTQSRRMEMVDPNAPKEIYVILIRMAIPFYGIAYLFYTYRQILVFRKRLEQNYSDTEKRNLRWLVYLISGISIAWLLELIQIIMIEIMNYPDTIAYFFIYDVISLFFSFLVFKAISQPGLFIPVSFTDNIIDSGSVESKTVPVPDLTDEKDIALVEKLKNLMEEEKPFKQPDLSLPDLAAMLSIQVHTLSWLLNQKLGVSFYDFVNRYRVDEVKRLIKSGEAENYTLLAIAFEAGFSSKSTFNSVFKKFEGVTPSAYKNQ